jgi:hypothetical protein
MAAAAPAAAAPAVADNKEKIAGRPVEKAWSAPYNEEADTFDDFATFDPQEMSMSRAGSAGPGTPTRTLSSRQMSGQFEDEVSKVWEEDWDDEDVDDTFDKTMERIARNK